MSFYYKTRACAEDQTLTDRFIDILIEAGLDPAERKRISKVEFTYPNEVKVRLTSVLVIGGTITSVHNEVLLFL